MNAERATSLAERAQPAIDDLTAMIRRRYPQAIFAVTRGDDPEGIYLKATIDVDDVDEVLDQAVLDRLFTLQVEEELPLYLFPLQPAHRVLAFLEGKRQRHAVRRSPMASPTVTMEANARQR